MSEYVKEGTCGACKYHENKGDNTKGYCSYYRAYYYNDDSCSHYEESNAFHSGSSGCFLTTACCVYKGLLDDCYELETIRGLRDKYILCQSYGKEMIKDYYKEAPEIVKKINASKNSDEILELTYKSVLEIVNLIEMGKNDEAVINYMMMFHRLSKL